jgi:hypothetical protein
MAIMKKTNNNKFWRGGGGREKEPLNTIDGSIN